MSRVLILITLLLVSTTLWFIEFVYLWVYLTGTVVLYILVLIIIMIWTFNSSILYALLKLVPLAALNAPLAWGPKKKDMEEEVHLESVRSRFSVAQEFTTFGICIAALLWLLRMVFLNEDGY
ncbi:MAG TPA: hypothetical protein VGB26_03925 [Nitrospiria bacterium]